MIRRELEPPSSTAAALVMPRWFCRGCGLGSQGPAGFWEMLRDTPRQLRECPLVELPFALVLLPVIIAFEAWERSHPRCWNCDARLERGR